MRELVRGEAAAARSVALLPIEDLDEATPDSVVGQKFTNNFRAAFRNLTDIGLTPPAKKAAENLDVWKQQDWKNLGAEFGARNLLAGTVRIHNGKRRVTLQLVDTVSGATIKRWIQEGDLDEAITAGLANSAAAVVRARANHHAAPRGPNEFPEIDFVAGTA